MNNIFNYSMDSIVTSPLFVLLEAIYVIYMLNYFKTKYSLAHPFTYFENKFLYHPIGKADKPICNICPLGNIGSFFIAFFIILRWILVNQTNLLNIKGTIKTASIFILLLVCMLSLMNFNAVVYLIPYFVYEILYINRIKN